MPVRKFKVPVIKGFKSTLGQKLGVPKMPAAFIKAEIAEAENEAVAPAPDVAPSLAPPVPEIGK